MANLTRRTFIAGSAALSFTASNPWHLAAQAPQTSKRILVGSGTPDGILSFAWDEATGTLTPEGVAGGVSHSTWLDISPDRRYLYVACEVDEFQGKPTGAVASFRMPDAKSGGKLTPISFVASQGKGTCHLITDSTGHVVICANYSGGSA